MPFNGSGLFTRAFNWVNDAANGINITASRVDSDSNDFASGLSNCITRDGQGKPTGAIDFNGQNLSNVAALTTTGNTILGDAITDTLNVGAGGIQKDASGNVGIGVAPSSWGTNYKAIESLGAAAFGVASANVNPVSLYGNAYSTNVGDIYKTTGAAARLDVGLAGTWAINVAASGTAGNAITWIAALNGTADGRIYGKALHNNGGLLNGTTNQYVGSGTYTPTATNGTNIAASTPKACQWIRVGNVVDVSGEIDIDPTAAGSAVGLLTLSLPIPVSAFTLTTQLAGAGADQSGNNVQPMALRANTGAGNCQIIIFCTSAANLTWSFSFKYVVL